MVLDEVIETLERQLSEMEFFQNSDEAGPANNDVSKFEYICSPDKFRLLRLNLQNWMFTSRQVADRQLLKCISVKTL